MKNGDMGLLAFGVVFGLLVAIIPASCVATVKWCEGYSDGSGKACTYSGLKCVCAEDGELVEVPYD